MGATIQTDRTGRPIILYTYRGYVERGKRLRRTRSYSATTAEGRVLYPWITRRECQDQARSWGGIARFVSSET